MDNVAALRAVLEWYAEMGVDTTVEDTSQDRFAELTPPVRTQPQVQAMAVTGGISGRGEAAAMLAPDDAAIAARTLAAQAASLDALRALMEAFDGCALKKSATRLVFADGNPEARIMLVGEAPGREEDETGKPFVGRAGQLLDRMLAAIGLDRTQVYIANIVPWRPPGNRTPTPQEIAICRPFITRQVELCAPDLLVCVGAPSSQTMLEQRDGILRLRGRWFDYQCGARTIPALAMLHPAYLMRAPAQKKLAWRDLLSIETRLQGLPPR